MIIKRFEDLNIWRTSLRLTKQIYDLSARDKFAKDFGLRDQIRRAIVSVSSNIVEGFEKNNNNEFARFLRMSKGSVGEVRNQLYVAATIGYISDRDCKRVNGELEELAKQIGAFIVYLDKQKKSSTRHS